jgi:hypothetical protein
MMQRIALDSKNDASDLRIVKIYMSGEYDLYALAYMEGYFHLYHIDLKTFSALSMVEEMEQHALDLIEENKMGKHGRSTPITREIKIGAPILSYKQGELEDATCMHVRHPRENTGEKLQVFIMHGKLLYFWVQMDEKVVGTKMTIVKKVHDGKLHQGLGEEFYFLEKYDEKDPADMEFFSLKGKKPKAGLRQGRIRKVQMFYTTFDDDTIYQEMMEDEEIVAFSKDQDKNKLLLLCRTGAKKNSESIEPKRFLIKIFDEDTGQV